MQETERNTEEIDVVIRKLKDRYEQAVSRMEITDPLEYALYFTWKELSEKNKREKEG